MITSKPRSRGARTIVEAACTQASNRHRLHVGPRRAQGDHGLFRARTVDALMRPARWRPAPSARDARSHHTPVGLVDLAATFSSIAGSSRRRVSRAPDGANGPRRTVLTTFDVSSRRSGCACGRSRRAASPARTTHRRIAEGASRHGAIWPAGGAPPSTVRGRALRHREDPHQLENRWDDPAPERGARSNAGELRATLPAEHAPLEVDAPT